MKKTLLAGMVLIAWLPLQALETDWLEPEAGQQDQQTGTRIETISDDGRLITVSIPKSRLQRQSDIEELVIIGKRRTGKALPLPDVSYEWADDIDNDHYGLIIRIGSGNRLPIRLYFKAESGAQPQPHP